MTIAKPHVSVIIPTFRRPDFVTRAVRGALSQTLREIEVIVVNDALDAATDAVLRPIVARDPRLQVLTPARNLGNADARNFGIAYARGRWIAFLDDDDEWMPDKLRVQMECAESAPCLYPIVSCHMIARNELQDFVWPRRLPRDGEPLAEYLFCRSGFFSGEGIVQTSTIFTSASLLKSVPFPSGMRRYSDLHWILQAARVEGARVVWPSTGEPLSIWNMEHNRGRISNGKDGAYSLEWAHHNSLLMTRRAYAGFLLWLVSSNAAKDGDWSAFFPILVDAFRHGQPRPIDLLTHLANFTVPAFAQQRLAALAVRRAARRAGRLQGA